MKVIIAALAFVAVAAAAAVGEKEPVPIVRSETNQSPDGNYNFNYETGDGSSRNEEGSLKPVPDEEGQPKPVIVVKGSYSYTDPEGVLETIQYYADETGYHAEGPSVPKAASRR